MSALALLTAAVLAAAPGSIEVALAERTGPRTARLTLLKADERLQGICLELVGYGEDLIEQAREQVSATPVWLYVGARRVARGRVARFESAPSPTGPCEVAAEARFEDMVPLTTRSDVLWATTRDLGSQPLQSIPRGAVERARAAAGCGATATASARAVKHGTFVSLTCDRTAVVFVPAKGEPSRVLEDERIALLDVLRSDEPSRHTLVVAREVEGGRRVELWESDGRAAKRVDAWIW